MGRKELVELAAQGLALREDRQQPVGHAADDAAVLPGGLDRHALVGQRGDDLTGQSAGQPWGTGRSRRRWRQYPPSQA